jgi:DNA-binding transcriptional ArsR family regulator
MGHSAVADDVFFALSNATRRKVLEHLSIGPASVSELAAPFDIEKARAGSHVRDRTRTAQGR